MSLISGWRAITEAEGVWAERPIVLVIDSFIDEFILLTPRSSRARQLCPSSRIEGRSRACKEQDLGPLRLNHALRAGQTLYRAPHGFCTTRSRRFSFVICCETERERDRDERKRE